MKAVTMRSYNSSNKKQNRKYNSNVNFLFLALGNSFYPTLEEPEFSGNKTEAW